MCAGKEKNTVTNVKPHDREERLQIMRELDRMHENTMHLLDSFNTASKNK
tara:strand:+ start:570 stop:719 length:150 start_codon:yes stop_codon:yes gene_type:complete